MYKDTRLGGTERWYYNAPKDANMRIPDNILNCVTFLCCKITKGDLAGAYHPLGTGFFVGVREGNYEFVYVVTAKHVLDELRRGQKEELFCRVNRKDDTVAYLPIDLSGGWIKWSNPAIDLVAVMFPALPEEFDYNALPLEGFATNKVVFEQWIGLGDDLFVTGLFSFRKGLQKNYPILRTGTIAAMPQEPIRDKKTGEFYYAYLAEMRSIGGLSGSPVFVYLDKTRDAPTILPEGANKTFYLLGMIRGHWELNEDIFGEKLPSETRDENTEDVRLGFSKGENLNVGIALVTPAQVIFDLLMSENIMKTRQELAAYIDAEFGGIVEDASSIDENEFTVIDFGTALKRASRRISEPVSEKKETSE